VSSARGTGKGAKKAPAAPSAANGVKAPFRKVLIANRGEIAVRVIRACRELGIETVAIYSEVDRNALHVRRADEAWPCGPAPAAQSYLNIEKVIEIAKRSGAEAIHPGYGFLSERAAFARRCAEEGIVFIGPKPDTIESMGDKVIARQKMKAAGVPIVPGTTEKLTDEEAIAFAGKIGLPVMIKATAGGGGKGMRLVHKQADLASSIKRARSEARASFGDDSIYVEKFVEEPRHIEIQIMGDSHGNALHLFERECSIQRRHQKVIEEAPANRMPPELREKMGRAAVAAAKAVGYEGAGTCEFLVDKNFDFYFLEMNTRVQVEHPVTEMITNVDIVKTGIRIAAGEPIGFAQEDVRINGWAIECRIYAEDPENGFRPSPGEIVAYRPPGGPGVRNDAGVFPGAEVSVYYDPMVAKLITWGRDRSEAIARMRRALREYVVKGIKTSIPFHRTVLENARFLSGHFDTSFIETEILTPDAALEQVDEQEQRVAIMLAAIAAFHRDRELAARAQPSSGAGAGSPWKTAGRSRQLRGVLR
jgi:acetyl-CoA carboxylase biotin carboxylase subunit